MLRLLIPAAGLLFLAAPLAPSLTPAPSGGLDDPTIVAIFDAANTADIETGELAARRASHPDVQALARQFAHDHEAVRQQGRDLAQRLGVTPTPPADSSSALAQRQTMAQLRSASKADFDCLYLNHEIAFHDQVITAIRQTLLPAIQNPQLKDLVVKVAPAFQGHLEAARQLQRKYACQAG